MKTKIVIAFFIVTCQIAYSQKEVIPFYGGRINSEEILGKGRPFGPPKPPTGIPTGLLDPAPVATYLFEFLGSVYTTTNFSGQPVNLLNLSIAESTPILDSIDFRFYLAKSFKALDRKFTSVEYLKFRKDFTEASNNAKRKEILNLPENVDFKNALEDTKYKITRPKISFAQANSVNREFGIGIGARISAKLSKLVGANATLAAAVKDSVNKIFKVKSASYYEIALDDQYITVANSIMKHWVNHLQELEQSHDIFFAPALKEFYGEESYAIIAQAAVIEATFEKNLGKRIETAIKAAVGANVDTKQLTSVEIASIAAEAGGEFYKERNKETELNASSAFYYIKYCANTRLEFGAGVTGSTQTER